MTQDYEKRDAYKLTNYDLEIIAKGKHFLLKKDDFKKIENIFKFKNFNSEKFCDFNLEIKNNELKEYGYDFDSYIFFKNIPININFNSADLYIKDKKIELYIKRVFLEYSDENKKQIFSYIEKLTFVI